MSQVTFFLRFPITALDGLRMAAARPKKRLFGSAKDTYWSYLREHGKPVGNFRWSGSVMAVLTDYVKEKLDVDLDKSEYEELAAFMIRERKTYHAILTAAQRAAYYDRLDPVRFAESELRDYCNEFYGTDDAAVGRGMLDGLVALREALSQTDQESVIVFMIG